MWYFYILQSIQYPNFFYKGSTPDLRRRLEQHNKGGVQSTKHYYPFQLIYYEAYTTERAARLRESSVKKSGSVYMALMKRIKQSLKK